MKRPDLLAGENVPAEPRQKRSIEKRARLKKAGLALFGEKGYAATSIEDIARRADLAVGGFYQHFHSKRQLLLSLMDDLLEYMSRLNLRPSGGGDVRSALHSLLAAALAGDLRYLGAYRAWQEAVLSDPDLARKEEKIHKWTSARVRKVLEVLEKLPGARRDVDVRGLARVLDSFFWSLLSQAVTLRRVELERWIDSSVYLIWHAMFTDAAGKDR